MSELFPAATDTFACPLALLLGPSDGPEIAQPPDPTDPSTLPPLQTSTDGQDSIIPPPGQTSSDGQTLPPPVPGQTPPPDSPPGPPGPPGGPPRPPSGPKGPKFPKPRICFIFCKHKLPKWKINLGCRGPICKHIGPRRGCLGICDLFKCLLGCDKKGGGTITDDDKPAPDPGKSIQHCLQVG